MAGISRVLSYGAPVLGLANPPVTRWSVQCVRAENVIGSECCRRRRRSKRGTRERSGCTDESSEFYDGNTSWRRKALQCSAVPKRSSSPPSETEETSEFGEVVSQEAEIVYEAQRGQQRLFSNLNQATLQHERGNMLSASLLVAGTTIGAGILAIPAVTQDAGFLASSATVATCWLYMVGTGLLVAEVNVNTMCELGAGGVSIV